MRGRPGNIQRCGTEELKERYPGYEVRQTNIVVDILGGFDRGLMDELSKIIGKVAAKLALESMQKTILLYETYSVVWAQTTMPTWTLEYVLTFMLIFRILFC